MLLTLIYATHKGETRDDWSCVKREKEEDEDEEERRKRSRFACDT